MILLWLLVLALVAFIIWLFKKSKYLSKLLIEDPKEFIRRIYLVLCRGFKFYGFPKFDYVAHREFFESVKGVLSQKPESMHLMTENVLEARFSEKIHGRKQVGLG